MRFRPCIDLRLGQVVQLVGSTVDDADTSRTVTNYRSKQSAADFARLYRGDGLSGGHVISIGDGNRDAVLSAVRAFPGGLQVGGGITPDNAQEYLEAGASHVIVTSYVFQAGRVELERLRRLVRQVGRSRLVLDLSCRWRDAAYWVVTDRWQRFTELRVDSAALDGLAEYCDEFLVHAVDVEGKRLGIDENLVRMLGECSPISVTYAGGSRSLDDLDRVKVLGKNRVDVTMGSALDIFGGRVPYSSVVRWQRNQEREELRAADPAQRSAEDV